MIDMNKKYRTGDGRSVRVLCTDANSTSPVKALVVGSSGTEVMYSYNADGIYSGMLHDTICNDLVEVVKYEHLNVDDKVWVRGDICEKYIPRHFCSVASNGMAAVFHDGRTSFTDNTGGEGITWNECISDVEYHGLIKR